ncbi:hypothetical protein [Natrinema limicola]|nr:hypothetical protein [Natrinema limicola]
MLYVVLGTALFVSRRRSVGRLVWTTAGTVSDAMPIREERPHALDD